MDIGKILTYIASGIGAGIVGYSIGNHHPPVRRKCDCLEHSKNSELSDTETYE